MANRNPIHFFVQIPNQQAAPFVLPPRPGLPYEEHHVDLAIEDQNQAILNWRLNVLEWIIENGVIAPEEAWDINRNFNGAITIDDIYDWNYNPQAAPRRGNNFLQEICRRMLADEITEQQARQAIHEDRPFIAFGQGAFVQPVIDEPIVDEEQHKDLMDLTVN